MTDHETFSGEYDGVDEDDFMDVPSCPVPILRGAALQRLSQDPGFSESEAESPASSDSESGLDGTSDDDMDDDVAMAPGQAEASLSQARAGGDALEPAAHSDAEMSTSSSDDETRDSQDDSSASEDSEDEAEEHTAHAQKVPRQVASAAQTGAAGKNGSKEPASSPRNTMTGVMHVEGSQPRSRSATHAMCDRSGQLQVAAAVHAEGAEPDSSSESSEDSESSDEEDEDEQAQEPPATAQSPADTLLPGASAPLRSLVDILADMASAGQPSNPPAPDAQAGLACVDPRGASNGAGPLQPEPSGDRADPRPGGQVAAVDVLMSDSDSEESDSDESDEENAGDNEQPQSAEHAKAPPSQPPRGMSGMQKVPASQQPRNGATGSKALAISAEAAKLEAAEPAVSGRSKPVSTDVGTGMHSTVPLDVPSRHAAKPATDQPSAASDQPARSRARAIRDATPKRNEPASSKSTGKAARLEQGCAPGVTSERAARANDIVTQSAADPQPAGLAAPMAPSASEIAATARKPSSTGRAASVGVLASSPRSPAKSKRAEFGSASAHRGVDAVSAKPHSDEAAAAQSSMQSHERVTRAEAQQASAPRGASPTSTDPRRSARAAEPTRSSQSARKLKKAASTSSRKRRDSSRRLQGDVSSAPRSDGCAPRVASQPVVLHDVGSTQRSCINATDTTADHAHPSNAGPAKPAAARCAQEPVQDATPVSEAATGAACVAGVTAAGTLVHAQGNALQDTKVEAVKVATVEAVSRAVSTPRAGGGVQSSPMARSPAPGAVPAASEADKRAKSPTKAASARVTAYQRTLQDSTERSLSASALKQEAAEPGHASGADGNAAAHTVAVEQADDDMPAARVSAARSGSACEPPAAPGEIVAQSVEDEFVEPVCASPAADAAAPPEASGQVSRAPRDAGSEDAGATSCPSDITASLNTEAVCLQIMKSRIPNIPRSKVTWAWAWNERVPPERLIVDACQMFFKLNFEIEMTKGECMMVVGRMLNDKRPRGDVMRPKRKFVRDELKRVAEAMDVAVAAYRAHFGQPWDELRAAIVAALNAFDTQHPPGTYSSFLERVTEQCKRVRRYGLIVELARRDCRATEDGARYYVEMRRLAQLRTMSRAGMAPPPQQRRTAVAGAQAPQPRINAAMLVPAAQHKEPKASLLAPKSEPDKKQPVDSGSGRPPLLKKLEASRDDAKPSSDTKVKLRAFPVTKARRRTRGPSLAPPAPPAPPAGEPARGQVGARAKKASLAKPAAAVLDHAVKPEAKAARNGVSKGFLQGAKKQQRRGGSPVTAPGAGRGVRAADAAVKLGKRRGSNGANGGPTAKKQKAASPQANKSKPAPASALNTAEKECVDTLVQLGGDGGHERIPSALSVPPTPAADPEPAQDTDPVLSDIVPSGRRHSTHENGADAKRPHTPPSLLKRPRTQSQLSQGGGQSDGTQQSGEHVSAHDAFEAHPPLEPEALEAEAAAAPQEPKAVVANMPAPAPRPCSSQQRNNHASGACVTAPRPCASQRQVANASGPCAAAAGGCDAGNAARAGPSSQSGRDTLNRFCMLVGVHQSARSEDRASVADALVRTTNDLYTCAIRKDKRGGVSDASASLRILKLPRRCLNVLRDLFASMADVVRCDAQEVGRHIVTLQTALVSEFGFDDAIEPGMSGLSMLTASANGAGLPAAGRTRGAAAGGEAYTTQLQSSCRSEAIAPGDAGAPRGAAVAAESLSSMAQLLILLHGVLLDPPATALLREWLDKLALLVSQQGSKRHVHQTELRINVSREAAGLCRKLLYMFSATISSPSDGALLRIYSWVSGVLPAAGAQAAS